VLNELQQGNTLLKAEVEAKELARTVAVSTIGSSWPVQSHKTLSY